MYAGNNFSFNNSKNIIEILMRNFSVAIQESDNNMSVPLLKKCLDTEQVSDP